MKKGCDGVEYIQITYGVTMGEKFDIQSYMTIYLIEMIGRKYLKKQVKLV